MDGVGVALYSGRLPDFAGWACKVSGGRLGEFMRQLTIINIAGINLGILTICPEADELASLTNHNTIAIFM